MFITDKKEMISLYNDAITNHHGIVNLDENDYRESLEIAKEKYAVCVEGNSLADAVKNLELELPKDKSTTKAIIIYILCVCHKITMGELDSITEFSEKFPTDVKFLWGIGHLNENTDKVKLSLFVFGD